MARRGRPLRVLIQTNSADLRIGAVNDALDLAALAKPLEAELVICGPLTREFVREAAARGLPSFRGASRMFSRRALPPYAADVARWLIRIAAWRPDVVHLNYAGYGPSLGCAAWLSGVPVVARAGGVYHPRNPANRWIVAYLANCDAHAQELLGSPLARRVCVTGDLFRPDRVRRTAEPIAPLPPRHDGIARVVFLGQLVERKGLHVLIDAFARMRHPAQLLLVGGDWATDGYPTRVRTLARTLGVDTRIVFENHRPDVGALLTSADVFVLPSLSEARPRSVIEAMSCGLPVVASDAGGLPSLITHDETGLLAPAGDAAALAAALDRLVEDCALRRRLGAAARDRVARDCRPDRTAQAYVQVYRRACAAGRGVAEPAAATVVER